MKTNQLKAEHYIPILVLVLLIILIVLYFLLPQNIASGLASYLSGFATVGILILTSFYVVYTNKQIKELQKQRQLQVQPLPNIKFIEGNILRPRLVHSGMRQSSDIDFRVDISFKAEMKNIGNGPAILLDMFQTRTVIF